MSIKFFITGGTIDGLEYQLEEDAPKEHRSLIPELLKQARVTVKRNVEELFHKDSRHISNDDRALIYKKCLECKEDKIIITHGAMTMIATAKYLGKNSLHKTIVLVGAMVPANKEKSDAFFNIGAAVSAVQLLPVGVYIVMNGQIFSWDNVKKNLEKAIFETEK